MKMARQLRGNPAADDLALYISVVDESGAELHREPVYKGPESQKGGISSRA